MSILQEIDPYLISIEFDKDVERTGEKSWVIGADVQIGDKLIRTETNRKKWFFRKETNDNINGDFMFVVCSPEFKNNPTPDYLHDIDRAYIQIDFDKDDAIKHVTNLVNHIGKVSLNEFTEKIHSFLITDEWDYQMNSKNNS